ncbi:acetylornithine deacetylase [Gammaproteobacteria bacterium]
MTTLPTLIPRMARLIAEPSVSSVSPAWDQGNGGVVNCLAEWFEGLAFRVEREAIPHHPGKFNLLATRGAGSGGLVLAGHTDTVPYDEALWHSDPFTLSERDGRLHGLGVTDMKGFFALVLEAIQGLDLKNLHHPLTVLATADEESSMCGARTLVQAHRSLGRYAVIGEPTGLRPVRLHKGIGMESVRILGQSGHSSDPALGRNALEGMVRVLGAILAWRDDLQSRHRNEAFRVAVPTLNLGHIHGGDNPNRICGACELHLDIRPLPGMDLGELRQQLRERVDGILAGSGLIWTVTPLFEGIPAFETPANSAIVQVAEALTGHPAESVAFATEGPFLRQLGLETLILGPGDIDQAHQPNEFLALDRLTPTVTLLQGLIHRFCLTP